MNDQTFIHPPPLDPPSPPPRRGLQLPAKLAIGVGLLISAGFGGFAIAEAASSATTSTSPYAANVADQGALQAASTPTAKPAPTHSCPNMGSHSSSSGSTSTSSLTAY